MRVRNTHSVNMRTDLTDGVGDGLDLSRDYVLSAHILKLPNDHREGVECEYYAWIPVVQA
jgi:hypothetical protein